MQVTATQLRSDLYNLLDKVIETGIILEIERKGHHLKVALAEEKSKLDNLELKPQVINGDPDELIDIDWANYWEEGNKL